MVHHFTTDDYFVNDIVRSNQITKLFIEEYPANEAHFQGIRMTGDETKAYSYLYNFLENIGDSPVFGYIFDKNVQQFGLISCVESIYRSLTRKAPPELERQKTEQQESIGDFEQREVTKRQQKTTKGYRFGYNSQGKRERATIYTQIVTRKGKVMTEKRLRSVKTGRFLSQKVKR